jgi:TPR repeat protein
VLALCVCCLSAPVVWAQSGATGAIKREYKGITFFAEPPVKGIRYDTPNLPGPQAVNKLIRAIDMIYAKMPKSRAAIERLKANGGLFLGYVPGALEDRMASGITAAIYAPDFDKQKSTRRRFVAVVGRHGIKWPLNELVPVLVHEITGHAIQDLEGRLKKMRNVDAECEAWLLQEYANQRLGFDKKQRKMVDFRKQLELKWCKPFKAYVRNHHPAALKAWNQLNPQVHEVLKVFPAYLAQLQSSGRLKAEKQLRKKLENKAIDRSMANATPKEKFAYANQLWKGDVGIPQNKPKALELYRDAASGGHTASQFRLGHLLQTGETGKRDYAGAVHWFKRAADSGHVAAQTRLAVLYITGKGTKQSKSEGLRLLLTTANKGYAPAQRTLGFLYKDGIGVNKDPVSAYIWFSRAAKQNDAKAKEFLDTLKKTMTKDQQVEAEARLFDARGERKK